jgi:hypothetical protein
MNPTRLAAVLITGIVLGLPLLADQPAASAEDEQLLRESKVGIDGPSLVAFFRQRTSGSADQERIKQLVTQLGDDSFQVRERASASLTELGQVATPALRKALSEPDPEVVRRAEDCLKYLERGEGRGISAAAARLLAVRKPEGAMEALLAYLPSAADEGIVEEVREALTGLAVREGKPDPRLVAALGDKLPGRRAAAAIALCRAAPSERPAVRKLLKDEDASVRLAAGLALAEARDKEAIPVLIELLGTQPYEEVWQVEDFLTRVAGDQTPAVSGGTDSASRRKFHDAWAAWWEKNGAAADLTRLDGVKPLLGCTLVILLDAGRIIDLDAKNQPRFTLDGLEFPLDAQYLPGDRVLVAEHNGNRVSERNRKGEIVWKIDVEEPIMAQRLPNGNTFVATRAQLLEFSKEGKQVFSYGRPDGGMFMKAQKLRNGEVAYVTGEPPAGGRFVRMEPKTGKELASFPVQVATFGGRIDVLSGNRVLVPLLNQNKVVEYDTKGNKLWDVGIDHPVAAVRLPNGNTLVTSMDQARAVEFNRDGKPVWEYRGESRVTRAFRR